MKTFAAQEVWKTAPMEKDDREEPKGGCPSVLDLPENPKRSDVIRAYAVVKYSMEKKLNQEKHTPQEIEDMEANLRLARDQCISMLTELEKECSYRSRDGAEEKRVEECQDSSEEDETPITMSVVELSEDTKPDHCCETTTCEGAEHVQNIQSATVVENCDLRRENLEIRVIKDADEQKEGICGFGWVCF